MKRLVSVVAGLALVLGGLLAAPATIASAKDCGQAPDGMKYYWGVSRVKTTFKSTGLHSNWVKPKNAPMPISYNETATAEVNASFSVTVGADAGVIFAKASVEAGVTVGASYSQTASWTYGADIPKDKKHEYRLRQRMESRSFVATKYYWKYDSATKKCGYFKVTSSNVVAPRNTDSALVWDVQKRKV